jgi:XTP/dITP diphosphohydrolase
MTRQVLLASSNPGKLAEFRAALTPLGIDVLAPAEAGLVADVEETGATFDENARLKAEILRDRSGMTTIADDSGLEVDVLSGAPGVYSHRFAGPNARDGDRNRKLLDLLHDVPRERRSARFVAALALAAPGVVTQIVTATVSGQIAESPRGTRGFGYDPLFIYPDAGKTFGQMSVEEKSLVSHRGKALDELIPLVARLFGVDILA